MKSFNKHIMDLIYSFDSTYKDIFDLCLENINSIEISRYLFYLNYKKYKLPSYNLRTIVFQQS